MEYFANTAKFNYSILRHVAKNNVNNNQIKEIAVISAQNLPHRRWVRDLTELMFPLFRVFLFLLTVIKTNPREKRHPRVESANDWWRIKSLFEFKILRK